MLRFRLDTASLAHLYSAFQDGVPVAHGGRKSQKGRG
jgi:hypothetical protein